ncbi:hypothetical protein BDU57DRAFT_535324 [Ampelomyces quisqualis]|uniref:BTB domain-containing protein n=1 Tax=Ampelomyces quisqualis TaxID=50730 RepID=A0A6A5R4J3_AMPQU|nr:hypothetical protein BDU57DRAFT_535324 [Ampelomyces quisqualis]
MAVSDKIIVRYFHGAFSGNFRETDEGTIPLDDVNIDVFDIFVDWLKKIDAPAVKPDQVPVAYHAYVLADRLMTPRKFSTYSAMTFAFNSFAANDSLIQLLVDAFCVNRGINPHLGD